QFTIQRKLPWRSGMMIVGSSNGDTSKNFPVGTDPITNISASVPLSINDLLARISRALQGNELLKSRPPNRHNQTKQMPLYFPDLHTLLLRTNKAENLIGHFGHVGYWLFHL